MMNPTNQSMKSQNQNLLLLLLLIREENPRSIGPGRAYIYNNIGILHSLQPHWRPPCDWYQGFQLWYVGSRPCNTAKWSGNIYKCYFNRIKMLFWINNLLDEPVVSRWHSLSFLRGWESQRQNKSKLTFKKEKRKKKH